MAIEIPPILKKKIGPLPVGAWVIIGGAAVAIVIYKKNHQATPVSDVGDMIPGDSGDNLYGVPYADSSGGGGGGGVDVPVTPPPDPNDGGGTVQDPHGVPGSPGNCPPHYYWNGNECVPKTVAGPAKEQPGATPGAAPGEKRLCPPAYHWNGFDCVPDYLTRPTAKKFTRLFTGPPARR